MTFTPNANLQLWYYRGDKIAKAPETWDDVFANCAALHHPPDSYGAIQRGERGNSIRYDFTSHLLGFGGSIVKDPENGDFTVTVNSPENLRALENFVKMLKTCGTANPGSVGQGEEIQLVASGKAMQAGIVIAAQAQMDDPEKSTIVGKIQYALMPRPADGKHGEVFGSWQMGIPKNIPDARKQAAMEFIKYFLSEKAQTAYAEGGGIPVNYKVLYGPLSEQEKFRWMKPYADATKTAVQVLMYAEGAQVDNVFGLRLNQALIGEMTPAAALNAAASDIHDIFVKSGRKTGMLPPLK
jgi:multiple sugar transport system substrate-binding protein